MSNEKTPWNPSQKAIKRVKNPLPVPTECPYCKGKVGIAHHEYIYSGKSFGDWPWVYACDDFEDCRSYVGIHPFTDIPLGTIADYETRQARKECKASFMNYCALTPKSRSGAYAALAAEMEIDEAECHFGWFSAEQCREAQSAALRLLDSKKG
jgi:hypothetical protein